MFLKCQNALQVAHSFELCPALHIVVFYCLVIIRFRPLVSSSGPILLKFKKALKLKLSIRFSI